MMVKVTANMMVKVVNTNKGVSTFIYPFVVIWLYGLVTHTYDAKPSDNIFKNVGQTIYDLKDGLLNDYIQYKLSNHSVIFKTA